jgi:hypothetical protein
MTWIDFSDPSPAYSPTMMRASDAILMNMVAPSGPSDEYAHTYNAYLIALCAGRGEEARDLLARAQALEPATDSNGA